MHPDMTSVGTFPTTPKGSDAHTGNVVSLGKVETGVWGYLEFRISRVGNEKEGAAQRRIC